MNRPEKTTLTSASTNAIRNICILAHVDHGKTTIADSLIAINGHISKRSAGNARYLDDRRDEQERGITMKCSAISLVYDKLVVNLIDTPGHIDFSTEVSAAIRICDGALIVVDVIEGVCVQTREALKQAFEERIKTILVINKIDRIIVEQQMEVEFIFQRIQRIIENCNAYVAELVQYDLQCTVEEEEYLFSPDLGNVIFASAYDGWGVTTLQVAEMFAEKFDESAESLNGKMWDFDYYVSKGKIVSGGIDKKKPTLFETLFLNTIHYVYFTLRIRLDRSKYPMIIEKFKIDKETFDMKHTDAKIQVKAILQAWKPLAETILEQVKSYIPPPSEIIHQRYEYLVNKTQYFDNPDLLRIADETIEVLSGKMEGKEETIAYVSKMFAVTKKMLEQQKAINIVVGRRKGIPDGTIPSNDRSEEIPEGVSNGETPKEGVVKEDSDSSSAEEEDPSYDPTLDNSRDFGVLGLARVFSGILTKGTEIYVQSSTYKPPTDRGINIEDFLSTSKTIRRVKIKQLYILLGRELIAVDSVSAGNICGIRGLEKYVARTGTLASSIFTLPLTERISLEPIVRNSIECNNPKDLPLLRRGLKFLKKIDSCVQVTVQETGELVLVTAGDVHLAKCIEDMQNMVAKMDINVSKPMVALKESILSLKKIDFTHTKITSLHVDLSQKDIGLFISVVAVPLPESVVNAINADYDILKLIEKFERRSGIDIMYQFDQKESNAKSSETSESGRLKVYSNELLMARVKDHLRNAFKEGKGPWVGAEVDIWALSKSRDFCNLLINKSSYKRSIWETLDEGDVRACMDHCIVNGFDMCCKAGPVCEEPLTNCAFIVSDYRLENYEVLRSMENMKVQMVANIPGAVRDLFREAVGKQMPRLMEPIFTTDIQVNTRILGKVYSVVSRRHGKVLDAVGMDDAEKTFLVRAQIPVAESHGFANEVRKTTSGQANPNLRFSHYEIIDGDPFYNFEEAEEDDEEENENADASKRAARLRKEVRKRKGLKIDDQVVVHAEKQRTLKK